MQTKQESKARIKRLEKVWTPDAELLIPHENEYVNFAYPSIGPNTYLNVGKQILEKNLQIPTGEQTTSLLYTAYFDDSIKDEPEFENIRNIMKDRWLWIFNRNLWTDKGVYVLPDFKAEGSSKNLNLNELEKMLNGGKDINGIRFSEDEKVRFAPKKLYTLGEHTPDSLSKDGFVIASFGKEGAEKIGEVSSKFRRNPRTFGIDIEERKDPIQRVSTIGGSLGVGGLRFYGVSLEDNWSGDAFGVDNKTP